LAKFAASQAAETPVSFQGIALAMPFFKIRRGLHRMPVPLKAAKMRR
jgi:hypothetical protein